ncbi:MAG: slipin family protein [Phenylobacterium sp.]|uniref:slipin family protein n=1 Tax=Phenylobacterium sp. TaxID=1871053 RepID=UPI00391CBEBB
MLTSLAFYTPILILLLALLASAIKILREYERGVVFTLGRFTGVKGPGLILLVPFVQQMVKVDLRTIVLDVPSQDVISRDNVSVQVNAVLYFRVVEPERATIQVENYLQATSQLAQTTLRSVLGKHDLDEMLAERDKLNADIQEILDSQTDVWGIKVANVEIKHVDIDESMVRMIARQAEAERERRAKIITAEGEEQAAQKLHEAAVILSRQPEAMQLRYLGALQVIANDRSNTIVFPFPAEAGAMLAGLGRGGGGAPRLSPVRAASGRRRSCPAGSHRCRPPWPGSGRGPAGGRGPAVRRRGGAWSRSGCARPPCRSSAGRWFVP